MKKEFKRFDMKKKVKRMIWPFRLIRVMLGTSSYRKHKPQIEKINMEGLEKGPYLLLCNHNAFLDFAIAMKAIYPAVPNFVVAIDGYLHREWVMRNLGCICKRKFTNDISILRQMKRVIDNKDVVALYPEAKYSLCGTTAVLPKSTGKLCKFLNVPVVTLICHGHHINSPFFNLDERGVCPTKATLKQILTVEDIKNKSVDEINRIIVENFQYDEYKWQKENNVEINYEQRAKGLQKVLYKCPHCLTENRMSGVGNKLTCTSCGKTWSVSKLNELSADDGNTEFSHIPDWYEWERKCVREEIEKGTYSSGVLRVRVDSLPNPKKFITLGYGTLVHDMNGFKVELTDIDGDHQEMIKTVPSLYSCHIEYDYLGKNGDCVDLNTTEDTWYCFPDGNDFSVTKMALATEELFIKNKKDNGFVVEDGLA